MKKESFLNIEIEPAPIELQLSVEMRCREIMNSNDVDSIKRYCTHLVRHQMKQDVFLASLLGRIVELEANELVKEIKEEKLKNNKTKKKSIDRIKKFFHIKKS